MTRRLKIETVVHVKYFEVNSQYVIYVWDIFLKKIDSTIASGIVFVCTSIINTKSYSDHFRFIVRDQSTQSQFYHSESLQSVL